MQGTGKLEVTNGDVFAIPIFGPLSGLLNTVFAGNLGYSMGRKATATFTVKEGNIHTDDFEISGNFSAFLAAATSIFWMINWTSMCA